MKKKIALVGNPNCGKTTLFNKITGANEHVGNRTGVTVSTVSRNIKGTDFLLYDLPGIYSLSPYSKEETVARDFLTKEKPDGIINIIDGCNIERNLYLTIQLLLLGLPMVIAVNMADEVEKSGISIDYKGLSEELGVKIISLCAKIGQGTDTLINCLSNLGETKKNTLRKIENTILKFEILSKIADKEIRLADCRYKYIEGLIKKYVKKPKRKENFSDKIDKVFLNRFLAIPIFLMVMCLTFYMTFNIGSRLNNLTEYFLDSFILNPADFILKRLNADIFIYSLIIDAIIGGVGIVLSFLPQILILFFMLSILEDTGYIARIAFILDSIFRKIGLSGKSFIPLIMGLGCTTPAVMAARTLDNSRDRRLTIMLTPFISCQAKLPIYALFSGIFFDKYQALIIFSLYLLGILIAILIGLIFKNTIFKDNDPPFVMELPSYRIPTIVSTLRLIWDKAKSFLIRAGTVIFFMNIVLWLVKNFDFSLNLTSDSRNSILGIIGIGIAPAFKPLGFSDWRLSVSLLTGLIAKESVVSSLSILFSEGSVTQSISLADGLLKSFTPLSAYSYMVFCLLYVPCVSAISTMYREIDSKKWALFSYISQMGIAYFISFSVYSIGTFIHF